MLWLIAIPFILTGAVLLTETAHKAIERALTPKPCVHPAWMYNRCIQCGVPR